MKEMMLRIKGTQKRQGEPIDIIEFMTMGRIYQKGDATYLVYDETEISGMEGSTTTIRVTEDSARMIRFTGDKEQNTRLDFDKGKTFQGYFSTPFGMIEVAVTTNELVNNLSSEDGGHINIDYDVELMGVIEAKNTLDIEVIGGKSNEQKRC